MDDIEWMAICFVLLFFISEIRAYLDRKIINQYRSMIDGYVDMNSKWQKLYDDAKELSMELLRVHQPDDYEECILNLSEMYARDILERNSKK